MPALNATLASWMKRKGLRDHQVADRIGVSRTQISRIRRGLLGPSVHTAMRLQDLTGIKFWRFLCDERRRRPRGRRGRRGQTE